MHKRQRRVTPQKNDENHKKEEHNEERKTRKKGRDLAWPLDGQRHVHNVGQVREIKLKPCGPFPLHTECGLATDLHQHNSKNTTKFAQTECALVTDATTRTTKLTLQRPRQTGINATITATTSAQEHNRSKLRRVVTHTVDR